MYLIWVGIIVAYIFTFIPEWTAWVILCFMALYDIVAVLVPGGPLKVGVRVCGGGRACACVSGGLYISHEGTAQAALFAWSPALHLRLSCT